MLLDDALLTSEVTAETDEEANEDIEEDDIIYIDEVELQEDTDMHVM